MSDAGGGITLDVCGGIIRIFLERMDHGYHDSFNAEGYFPPGMKV